MEDGSLKSSYDNKGVRYLAVGILAFVFLAALFFIIRFSNAQREPYKLTSKGYAKELRYGIEFPKKVLDATYQNRLSSEKEETKPKASKTSKNTSEYTYKPLTPDVLVNSTNPFLARVIGKIKEVNKENKTITINADVFKAVEVNKSNYRPLKKIIYVSERGAHISAIYSGLNPAKLKKGELIVVTLRFEPSEKDEEKGNVFVSELHLIKDLEKPEKEVTPKKKR